MDSFRAHRRPAAPSFAFNSRETDGPKATREDQLPTPRTLRTKTDLTHSLRQVSTRSIETRPTNRKSVKQQTKSIPPHVAMALKTFTDAVKVPRCFQGQARKSTPCVRYRATSIFTTRASLCHQSRSTPCTPPVPDAALLRWHPLSEKPVMLVTKKTTDKNCQMPENQC